MLLVMMVVVMFLVMVMMMMLVVIVAMIFVSMMGRISVLRGCGGRVSRGDPLGGRKGRIEMERGSDGFFFDGE